VSLTNAERNEAVWNLHLVLFVEKPFGFKGPRLLVQFFIHENAVEVHDEVRVLLKKEIKIFI